MCIWKEDKTKQADAFGGHQYDYLQVADTLSITLSITRLIVATYPWPGCRHTLPGGPYYVKVDEEMRGRLQMIIEENSLAIIQKVTNIDRKVAWFFFCNLTGTSWELRGWPKPSMLQEMGQALRKNIINMFINSWESVSSAQAYSLMNNGKTIGQAIFCWSLSMCYCLPSCQP